VSSDFWWGLACIPLFIGACAIGAAGVIVLMWTLARFGGDKWRVGGEYPPENVAAIIAMSKSFHRVLYIPGFFLIRAKREGFGDDEFRIRATAIARAVRKAREEFSDN
jgi:hypothetical protein